MINTLYNDFTKKVEDYDLISDKVVMKNTELHSSIIDLIPKRENLKVLDLGCGNGKVMKEILERFDNSSVWGVDNSIEIIESAKINLKEYEGRFELICQDLRELDIDLDFDVILTSVTLHNLAHKDKEKVFSKIYSMLKEGGVFINGDFFEAEDEEKQKLAFDKYQSFLEENLEGEELETWRIHSRDEDKPMKISEQLSILNKIGFQKIKITWEFNNEVVYGAYKSKNIYESLGKHFESEEFEDQKIKQFFEINNFRTITFFGSHKIDLDHPNYFSACKLARDLGKKEFGILTGGGPGIMRAANKGASISKTHSLGIQSEILVDEKESLEAFTDSIGVSSLSKRKVAMIMKSEVLIFFPGGFGTLDELFEAILLMQVGAIEKKPIICFNSDYWEGLFKWLDANVIHKNLGINGKIDISNVHIVDDVNHAMKIILK